jgi:sugar-specific transcriptional regulator TrmB
MITQADQHRIIAQLKLFGCNERETNIYLQCLKMGPSSVQGIASKLKQNRVTVHHAVEQLVDKGFLYETRKGKRRLIAPEEPDVLYRLLQRKENEIEMTKFNLAYVTNLLNSVTTTSTSVPTVKLYEGVDGFKRMLEESLENKGKKIWLMTYVDLFSRLLDPDYLENYFVRRAAKDIHTQLIFPPCDFAKRVNAKAKEYKIEVRLMPPHLKWASGFFTWDDKISIKSFTEGQLTCTIIQNKDIADFFQRIVFDMLWGQAEPMG